MTIHVQAVAKPVTHDASPPVELIRHFSQLRQTDSHIAGGKGANLGELHCAHFPVPSGFVITAEAYLHAMDAGGVRAQLLALADGVMPDDPKAFLRTADMLRALVEHAGMTNDVKSAIRAAYAALGDSARVSVRSAATDADLTREATAGVNETFTNVRGEDELLTAVFACWMSLWGTSVVSYRAQQHSKAEPSIAVVVQRMINADKSGVALTTDPSSPDASRIVIKAAFGLGEVVVTGQVEPDTYTVLKTDLHLLEARPGHKSHKIVAGDTGDMRVELDAEEGKRRVLTDHEVCEVAGLAVDVERHYGRPQEIQWALYEGTLYVLQSRPLTALAEAQPSSPHKYC